MDASLSLNDSSNTTAVSIQPNPSSQRALYSKKTNPKKVMFQRNFCSNDFSSTKRDQKKFIDGSLETAWIYNSFKTNRLEKKLRTPEMVRPSILAVTKAEPLFQRKSCSNKNFSTKWDQKMFVDGSLIAYTVFVVRIHQISQEARWFIF